MNDFVAVVSLNREDWGQGNNPFSVLSLASLSNIHKRLLKENLHLKVKRTSTHLDSWSTGSSQHPVTKNLDIPLYKE